MSITEDKKSGEVLMVLRDKDVFPNAPEKTEVTWKDRPTGKVVLLNSEGKVALIGNKVHPFLLLPGGGIEDGEDILDGLKRECLEEIGCQIEVTGSLGVTEDFRSRDSKHCMSYGYPARVTAYGSPTLTKDELDVGTYVEWLLLDDVQQRFADQEEKVRRGEVAFYNTCFNIIRDSLFIRQAQALLAAKS